MKHDLHFSALPQIHSLPLMRKGRTASLVFIHHFKFPLFTHRTNVETSKAPHRSIQMIVRNNLDSIELKLRNIDLTNGRWIWKPQPSISPGSLGIWNVAFAEKDAFSSPMVAVEYDVTESKYVGFKWDEETDRFGVISGITPISDLTIKNEFKPELTIRVKDGANDDEKEFIVTERQ